MKRVISLIFLSLLILVTGIIVKAAQDLDALTVHYYRYSDSNTTHTAWVWQYVPVSGDGEEHVFSASEIPNWLTIDVDLTSDRYRGSTVVGIIIKEGSGWDGPRQPGGDRHIDLSKVEKDGKAGHVYFVQEDEAIYYNLEDADVSDKVLDAYVTLNHEIKIQATNIPDKVEIYENSLKIDTFDSITDYSFTLKPTKFDISNIYTIKAYFEDVSADYTVSFRMLYDTKEYNDYYYYDGDLGVIYTKEKSTFRLWSPVSEQVTLQLYSQGHPNYDKNGKPNDEANPKDKIEMTNIGKGVWEAVVNKNLEGMYYTFEVNYNGRTFEIVDPYAYSTGANGLRAQVVNFEKTNPKYWAYNTRPDNIKNMTDYIIYELHVRDLTTHKSWGGDPSLRGTFMGVAQGGTSYTKDDITISTGLDHLAELGVNAVHFLPIFDFGYVDETRLNDEDYMNQYGFNWGYMPYNFNTPEGSFSTNPFDGYTRVKELKTMIQALHFRNIRVIMDVVYNHTGETEGSQFEKSMPGYYFRQNQDGSYSNGSGTGNETASERSMFRKYMIDSIIFWAKEYNISGFRFDLMGLHDVETMNEIRKAVNEIDPTIILYGEPWTGGSTPLDPTKKADKDNISKLNNVAAFNDNSRDAIKKGWNIENRNIGNSDSIRYAISGGVAMDNAKASEGTPSYHVEPYRTINYVTAHDDETLRDLNYIQGARDETLFDLQKQSNAFILTSQGIPFLHAGVDFMRSKPVPEEFEDMGERIVMGLSGNSYNMPDVVNQLNWDDKVKYLDIHNYYRHLIAFRRITSNLRLPSSELIKEHLSFINPNSTQYIGYRINGNEDSPEVVVIHSNNNFATYTAEKDYIRITSIDGKANARGISKVQAGAVIEALEYGTIILVEDNDKFQFSPDKEAYLFFDPKAIPKEYRGIPSGKSSSNLGLILGITIPAILLVSAGVVAFVVIRKRKQ